MEKSRGQVTIGDNSSSSKNEGRPQAAAQRDEQLCRKTLHGHRRGAGLYGEHCRHWHELPANRRQNKKQKREPELGATSEMLRQGDPFVVFTCAPFHRHFTCHSTGIKRGWMAPKVQGSRLQRGRRKRGYRGTTHRVLHLVYSTSRGSVCVYCFEYYFKKIREHVIYQYNFLNLYNVISKNIS